MRLAKQIVHSANEYS